ncbi:ABC transporter ATP-binding protein [Verrucomicrobium sp. BvORR034]|uniref:ABC transporter ATP-binding protein n=1 Tax=Verrucomicrobium sp. BvORR034 TaxID=1396418 RepID=UPI0006795E3C|nr:ABC transporter ATP-binding protein [Verrucomicrobium sp. BvORR034]
MSAVIDVRHLTKAFDGRKVVDDFSIRVEGGRIHGFLGPNGSGKTTTIRMLCGLLTPDAGEGTCLDFDIRTQTAEIKKHVGYMTQKFSLYEDLSISENLDFIARIYAVPRRKEVVAKTLERLGLATRRQQLAGSLSGGWKQRLALAACLLHEPKLLLLDEPTAGVDPKARRDFWENIHQLASEGMTVLVSTHYMDEAEQCHELVYMAYGRKVVEGTAGEVVDRSGLDIWEVSGSDLPELSRELRQLSEVEMVVPFGLTLHVSGRNHDALEKALAPFRQRSDLTLHRIKPGLEDVFISLMDKSVDNFG